MRWAGGGRAESEAVGVVWGAGGVDVRGPRVGGAVGQDLQGHALPALRIEGQERAAVERRDRRVAQHLRGAVHQGAQCICQIVALYC